MANLTEEKKWEEGIYQLETTDPVMGGPNGISNRQANQLANRTAFLKEKVEGFGTAISEMGETVEGLSESVVESTQKVEDLEGVVGTVEAPGEGEEPLPPLTERVATLESKVAELEEGGGGEEPGGGDEPGPGPEPSDVKIFGYAHVRGNGPSSFTRLLADSDPNHYVNTEVTSDPVPGTDSSEGSSFFDEFATWSGMKRRNINGVLLDAWEGNLGFSTTDKDVMTWIPKYWLKKVHDNTNNIDYVYVATGDPATIDIDGFMKQPGSGRYFATYPASEVGGSLMSVSGKAIKDISLVDARTKVAAKGTGWGLMDPETFEAVATLIKMEFATYNLQAKLGTGGTGNTGVTDTLQYHTGNVSGRVKYRTIEDIYTWKQGGFWIDGLLFKNGIIYYCADRTKYAADVTDDYVEIATYADTESGFIKSEKNIESLPWLNFIPDVIGDNADKDSFISDYAYLYKYSNVAGILVAGSGDTDAGTSDGQPGLFSVFGYSGSNSYGSISSYPSSGLHPVRLIYIPPEEV